MTINAMMMDESRDDFHGNIAENDMNFVIVDSDLPEVKQLFFNSHSDQNDQYVNRQIQLVNHIQNYEGYSYINFLIQN